MTPNRIVAGATALLGAAVLLAGLLADLGTAPQVAAILAGVVAVLTPAVVWLRGWQAWEARQGEADEPVGWEDLREQLARLAAGLRSAGAAHSESAAVSGYSEDDPTVRPEPRDDGPPNRPPPAEEPDPDAVLAAVADATPREEDLTYDRPEDVAPEDRGRP